jgi:RND family efflux transporter MFP subunit
LGYRRQRKQDSTAPPGSLKDLKLPCFLQLADETDFPHQGELDFAASEVNASTGTARIRAEFKNEDRALSSGLFVRARVPIGKPYQAVMIPERALATDQSIKYVYVVGDDHKAERRNVELGRARGDQRIIKSGIKAGEQVIVKGLQRVKPGQKVEVEQAAPAPQVSRPE